MHRSVCSIVFLPSILTAARSACWQIACLMCSYSVTLSPKEREHTICCFAGGASSRLIQLSPFSSRTVSLQYHAKCVYGSLQDWRVRAPVRFVIPMLLSFLAILLPTPQTSSTGCGGKHLLSPDVRRDGQHTTKLGPLLLLHWADFASVLVLTNTNTDPSGQCALATATDFTTKRLEVSAKINSMNVQKHLNHRILFHTRGHSLYNAHHPVWHRCV